MISSSAVFALFIIGVALGSMVGFALGRSVDNNGGTFK